MVCYIAMGWCIATVTSPMIKHFHPMCLIFLLLGGIAYTLGAVLYGVSKKFNIRYMHSVFHLFVLAGSILHFFSILFYVMSRIFQQLFHRKTQGFPQKKPSYPQAFCGLFLPFWLQMTLFLNLSTIHIQSHFSTVFHTLCTMGS